MRVGRWFVLVRLFSVQEFIKPILSAFHVTPMDGMGRTVMITSQTICAPLVVKPHGRCSFYVVDRAHLLTKPTLDTCLIVHPELRVGDEMLVIISANNVGIGKGNASFDKLFNVSLAF